MKVIWISPEMPYPANTGGRIGIYKRLQYFGRSNEVHFFCIIDNDEEKRGEAELLRYCRTVHLYNRNKSKYRGILKSIYAGPFACVSRSVSKMKASIEETYQSGVDYIIVDFPQMLGCLSDGILKSGKVVMNQHNIEYITMANIARSIKNPIKRFIFKYDAMRLKKWEEMYYTTYDFALYTFVSIEDKTFFEKRFNKTNTYLVPVGSEISDYKDTLPNNHNIAYFGKMEYPPNAEAAIWFVQNVFLKVKAQVPDARFYIVGKNPLPKLVEIGKNVTDIIVTGTVDSVEPYYNQSRLVVVPLSHGGGVKVKLLEALGRGALLLSTNKGMEGTGFTPNVDLLTANSANDMVSMCVKALTSPDKFEAIRRTGYDKVRNNYSWKSIVDAFAGKLNLMLENKKIDGSDNTCRRFGDTSPLRSE